MIEWWWLVIGVTVGFVAGVLLAWVLGYRAADRRWR